MSVSDCAVVSAPVVHHRVNVLERSLVCEARSEPCCRPCRVGALVENSVDLGVNVYGPSLCELQNRAESLHEVQANHCYGHAAACEEVRREAAAAEVVAVSRIPCGSLEASVYVLVCHLPEVLHHRLALCVGSCARAIECCSARVDEVDNTVGSHTGEFLAGYALNSLGAPVCAHVREDLCSAREQVVEEHSHAVASVVLGSECDSSRRPFQSNEVFMSASG